MLKVGLVGVGGISGAHIPAWEHMDDVELCALCDIRPERLAPHQATKRCYTDFREMLEKEQLDILDICLPTFLHADYAVMAMERGIHVICEKPISLRQEDVRRVYDTAAKNGVRFMVAHVLRFWKEYVILKQLVEQKTYGELLSGTLFRLGSQPRWSWDNWMADEDRSGLVPFDLHIHDLDFLVYLFGAPKRMVTHRTRRPEQDYLCATYEYENFFLNCESAWYAAKFPFTAGFRLQFDRAVVVLENGELTAYLPEGDPVKLSEQETVTGGVINLTDLGPYANEIRYFTDCVIAGKPADMVKLEELETVIRLLDNFKQA